MFKDKKGKKQIKKPKAAVIIIITAIMASVIVFAKFASYMYPHVRGMIKPYLTDGDLSGLNLDGYDKLMIVAHPDDELLWGGIRLLQDKWLVVCVTNGYNDVRKKEFEAVMEKTGNRYLIMNYTDKLFNIRSDWKYLYKNIQSDIKRIVDYKNWEEIVTHNAEGEYGHEHHKMVNAITTDLAKDRYGAVLKFFGKYYKKSEIEEGASPGERLPEELLIKKEEIIKLYKSQTRTMEKLGHMMPYENWTPYTGEDSI